MFYASIVYYGNLDITWEVWNMRLCENILILPGQSWKNITKTMTVYKLRGFNLSSLPFKKRYRSSLEFITLRQKCIWREIRSSCLHFWDTLVKVLTEKKLGTIFIDLKILAPKHNLVQMLKNIAHCTLTSSEYFWFFLYNAPFWDNSFFESPIFWLGKKGK